MQPSRLEATAESIERMMGTCNGTLFPTPRDVLVSHILAFLPKADCWIQNVRVVEHEFCHKTCFPDVCGECPKCGGTEYPF
jgi:hypothetical protein